MNCGWHLLAPLLALGACSVLHDELPNDPPIVHLARMTCQSPDKASPDTLINSVDAVCRVQRGGEIRFEIRAADEDDDPVFYEWRAPAGGSFRDELAQEINSWFAPPTIAGSSEQFIVQVLVTDRNCNAVAVPDLADRQRCAEDARVLVENFLVEVVQREPTLEVTTDATSAFSAPQILIDAFGSDPDGDRLEYHWDAGDSLGIWPEPIRDEETGRQIGSHAVVVAFFPGSYKLRVSASDGAANVEREIALHVPIEPPLPAGDMVRLVLPTTSQTYEIDAYEYPNAKNERPQSASFFQAASLCAAEGKRLCKPDEWRTACQAGQMRSFSSTDDLTAYGSRDHFGVRFCNVPGSVFSQFSGGPAEQLAPSGSFPNCGGATGVFDLTGNIDEWITSIDDAGDLAVYIAASSVSESGACDGVTRLGILSMGGHDPYDLEVLAEVVADWPLQNYEQPLLGFRCCR